MAKLVLAVASAGMGMFFWHYTEALPRDMVSFFLAAILAGLALSLLMLFFHQLSTRGPWR